MYPKVQTKIIYVIISPAQSGQADSWLVDLNKDQPHAPSRLLGAAGERGLIPEQRLDTEPIWAGGFLIGRSEQRPTSRAQPSFGGRTWAHPRTAAGYRAYLGRRIPDWSIWTKTNLTRPAVFRGENVGSSPNSGWIPSLSGQADSWLVDLNKDQPHAPSRLSGGERGLIPEQRLDTEPIWAGGFLIGRSEQSPTSRAQPSFGGRTWAHPRTAAGNRA